MEKHHFLFNGNMTPNEIHDCLRDNADGRETITYTRRLSDQELIEKRELYVENSLQIAEHDEELADHKKVHKLAVTPLKDENKKAKKTLRTKHEELNEVCYKFIDHAKGIVEFVNSKGHIVDFRKVKPDEKQGSLIRAIAVNE